MTELNGDFHIKSVDLPLNVDSYPDDLGNEVLAATMSVVRAEPIEPLAEQPVESGSQDLPLSAPRIIGLAGKPRSGKDVAADYLVSNYASVAKVNFSDPIIEEVNDFLAPFSHKIAESNKSAPIYRSLLQAWGVSRRFEDENYWVNLLREQISDLSDDYRLVVVCGVRALSDAALIDDLGGRLWMISRPGNSYQAEHSIESQFDGLGQDRFVIIDNSKEDDLDTYYHNIDHALAREAEGGR